MEYKLVANDHDRKQFIEAWIDSFDREYTQEMYEWMFDKNNAMYAVYEDEKIVAGYCLLKHTIIHDQKMKSGALCNNVFVRPDYRGLSLFVKLGRYALEKAAEHTELVIGIPNENAVLGHKRVGWTFQNKIHFLEKALHLKKANTDNIHMVALTLNNYDDHKDAIEALSLKLSKNRSFSVVKDQHYFKWRYLLKPSVDYKIYLYMDNGVIEGYIVCKLYKASKRVHILDLEASHQTCFECLVEQTSLFGDDYDLVNVWDSSIYSEWFLKNGFNKSDEFNNLIAINPQEKGQILFGEQKNIVLGDNEVF